MAQPEKVNQYKVTVISKYKDFDGTIRESKTHKTVYAKSEDLAKSQVTKQPKLLTKKPVAGTENETSQWNSPASKYVTAKEVTVELIKEEIVVIV